MDQQRPGSARLSITVPANVWNSLARRALEEGRSMSNLAAYLLERHAKDNTLQG
jgi:hypothetical protein